MTSSSLSMIFNAGIIFLMRGLRTPEIMFSGEILRKTAFFIIAKGDLRQ